MENILTAAEMPSGDWVLIAVSGTGEAYWLGPFATLGEAVEYVVADPDLGWVVFEMEDLGR